MKAGEQLVRGMTCELTQHANRQELDHVETDTTYVLVEHAPVHTYIAACLLRCHMSLSTTAWYCKVWAAHLHTSTPYTDDGVAKVE